MLHTVAAYDCIGEENAFAVLARATKLAADGRDIINLGIGQPDFKTPDHIVEAAIKALRDGHHGYTPANGILPAREAVARRTLTMTGIEISPESVMIMPGGKPTMYAAITLFGEPGAEIVPELFPIEGEIVVDKPGKGAFHATGFGEHLARLGVSQLVFAGVTTEVCVQTTMREANDRGFECLIAEDATASYFPDFKRAAIDMMTAQGAIVGWAAPVDAILEALGETSRETAAPLAPEGV